MRRDSNWTSELSTAPPWAVTSVWCLGDFTRAPPGQPRSPPANQRPVWEAGDQSESRDIRGVTQAWHLDTSPHGPLALCCHSLIINYSYTYLHLKASPLSSRLASRTWIVCFCILPKIWRIMISGNQFHELDHRDGQTVRSVLATGATGPGFSRDTWLVLRLRVIMWVLWDHCNIPGQSQHINPRTSLSQQMTGVTFNTWIPPHSDRTGSNIWCLLFIFSK